MENHIWKLARQNNKKVLPKEVYTTIKNMKEVKVPFSELNTKQFREAFHSEKTIPEIRNMLINKVFNPKANYENLVRSNLGIQNANLILKPVKSNGKYHITFMNLTPKITNSKKFRNILQEFSVNYPDDVLVNRFLKLDWPHEQKPAIKGLMWVLGFNDFFDQTALTISSIIKLTDIFDLFDPYDPETTAQEAANKYETTLDSFDEIKQQLNEISRFISEYTPLLKALEKEDEITAFYEKFNDVKNYFDLLKDGVDVPTNYISSEYKPKFEIDIAHLDKSVRNLYAFNLSLVSVTDDFLKIVGDIRGIKLDPDILDNIMKIHGNKKPPVFVPPQDLLNEAYISSTSNIVNSYKEWRLEGVKTLQQNKPKRNKLTNWWNTS